MNMDGATTTTSTGSTNSSASPGGGPTSVGVSGSSSSGKFGSGYLSLGNLGGSGPAVVGGMGLFSVGGADGSGLSSSSFGTSLAGSNGFTSEGGAGRLTVGNGSGNPSFDLNDFPSLGGAPAVSATASATVNDNRLAAALRQQQQLLQQQAIQQGGGLSISVGGIGVGGVVGLGGIIGLGGLSGANSTAGAVTPTNTVEKSTSNLYRLAMSSGIANGSGGRPAAAGNNFNMTTEDFPALGGGSKGGDAGGVITGVAGLGQQPSDGTTLLGGTLMPLSVLDPPPAEGGNSQLDYTGLIGSTGVVAGSSGGGIQQGGRSSSQTRLTSMLTSATQSELSSPSTANIGRSSSSGNAGSGAPGDGGAGAIGGDYGLMGLLSVIRMMDADRNRLALGSDLTVLGLNLNTPDVLYSMFGGPFSDRPATKEPHYQLPMCYYMQPPALKTGHLSKFQLETLFYIFYALPRDVLQAYAAQELYIREWRYHVESKLWFKRATSSETGGGTTNSSSGGGAGQFVYFDINTWERRMYGNVNTNIAGGFLTEDDVRVKFPSS